MAPLDEVVAAVLSSRRYRTLYPPTVRRMAQVQLSAAGGRVAEATKRTKRALHQIFGAYVPQPPRYARLLEQLREAPDEAGRRAVLGRAMGQHASTRERLEHLEAFYAGLAEPLGGSPRAVLDVACGLGPLAAPWWGLATGTVIHAWDIDVALVEFVAGCLRELGMEPRAATVDLLDVPSWPRVDVALVLKTLPCLEQQRAGAGEALLAAIDAPRIVVSFPTRSLGGRSKGMRDTYATWFEALLSRRGWDADACTIGPELVYVVRREMP